MEIVFVLIEIKNKILNKFRLSFNSSGCIFKFTLITQTNLKKERGVLLPGAPDRAYVCYRIL